MPKNQDVGPQDFPLKETAIDDYTLALHVRRYISKSDPRLYQMIREEYQRYLASNNGTLLDFLLYLATTHERLNT